MAPWQYNKNKWKKNIWMVDPTEEITWNTSQAYFIGVNDGMK